MMTPEQTELLRKMQIAGLPNAKTVNPLSMGEHEASEFFKQNLPMLTYMDAQAYKVGEPNTLSEKRFFGVSDSDCEHQIKHWMDDQPDYELVSKPNPKYGGAELWVDYFRQPTSQVSLAALEKTFKEWELKVQSVPYLNPEDRPVSKILPAVESQPYYERLKHDEAAKIIEQIREGKGLPEGYEVGHSNGFDSRIDGKYKKLLPLTEDEQDALLYGDREALSADAQEVYNAISHDENYTGELDTAIESELIDKGYLCESDEMPNCSLHERLKPEVKLVDIHVQKFAGMTQERPAKEIYKNEFSALECCFDDCPEDKLECFEIYSRTRDESKLHEVTAEQKQMIRALQAEGKAPKIGLEDFRKLINTEAEAYITEYKDMPVDSFPRVTYKNMEAKTPEVSDSHEYGKINQWELKRAIQEGGHQADYLQREVISDLVKEGRIGTPGTQKELLGRIQYMTDAQAKEMLAPHMDEAAGASLLGKTKEFIDEGKLVMTPNLKTVGDCMGVFRHHRNMDYPMKVALRDLVDSGRLEIPREKIDFVSTEYARNVISQNMDALAGKNMKNYLAGKIEDGEIGELDRELSQNLTIRTGMEIIYSTSKTKERSLGLATPNQIRALQRLANDGKIKLDNIDLNHLNMQSASSILQAELGSTPRGERHIDYSKMTGPASMAQLKYVSSLVSHGSIDLQGRDINTLTKGEASELIASVSPEKRAISSTSVASTGSPATKKQKSAISELVKNKSINRLSFDDWKNLTFEKANEIIGSVTPDLVKEMKKPSDNELSMRKGSISEVQKDTLSHLMDENKVSRSHKLNDLSSAQADRLIKSATGQYVSEPATQKQKDFIARLVKSGKIERMTSDKWNGLTKTEASSIIKENTAAFNHPGQERSVLATKEQKDMFRAAVAENLVEKVSFDEWRNMTSAECEKRLSVIPEERRLKLESHVRNSPNQPPARMPSSQTMEH